MRRRRWVYYSLDQVRFLLRQAWALGFDADRLAAMTVQQLDWALNYDKDIQQSALIY